MTDTGKLSCSFCGKLQAEVRKLIAGPSVYICDECTDLAVEILAEERAESSQAERASASRWSRAAELRERVAEAVVGQQRAKRALSTAIARYTTEGATALGHVLLLGPVGVGKTHLTRALAQAAGLSFSVVEAMHLAGDRYLTRSDVFEELVERPGKTRAQPPLGIVCVERLDWIAVRHPGRDLALRAQAELLAMMDGRRVKLRNQSSPCDTTRVLFVCSGVFDGVELSSAGPRALLDFGLMPELVSRLTTICVFDPLDEAELRQLVQGSLDRLIEELAHEGAELSFADEAVCSIARAAARASMGARGVESIVEEFASQLVHELHAKPDGRSLLVSEDMVEAHLAAREPNASTSKARRRLDNGRTPRN